MMFKTAPALKYRSKSWWSYNTTTILPAGGDENCNTVFKIIDPLQGVTQVHKSSQRLVTWFLNNSARDHREGHCFSTIVFSAPFKYDQLIFQFYVEGRYSKAWTQSQKHRWIVKVSNFPIWPRMPPGQLSLKLVPGNILESDISTTSFELQLIYKKYWTSILYSIHLREWKKKLLYVLLTLHTSSGVSTTDCKIFIRSFL